MKKSCAYYRTLTPIQNNFFLALDIKYRNPAIDYEEAYDYALGKASAQNLTQFLMDERDLWCHLQDIVQIARKNGWDGFEFGETDAEDGDE